MKNCRLSGHTWLTLKDGTVWCGTCTMARTRARAPHSDYILPSPSQIAAEVVAAIPQLDQLIEEWS